MGLNARDFLEFRSGLFGGRKNLTGVVGNELRLGGSFCQAIGRIGFRRFNSRSGQNFDAN
jgi:hypothetical protein